MRKVDNSPEDNLARTINTNKEVNLNNEKIRNSLSIACVTGRRSVFDTHVGES
jgi:hypothetical protein